MPKRGPKPLRVLIADDHRLFAEALEAILTTDERIEVVGQAGDGEQAVELARELGPDVVLMDVSMPVLDGFQATREIRAAGEKDACSCSRARTPAPTSIARGKPVRRAT